MISPTHSCIDVMWETALSHVLTHGDRGTSRDGDAIEVRGWSARLAPRAPSFLVNTRRHLSSRYASAELLWYLSGQANADMIRAYAPRYASYVEPNGEAYGAYGARMALQLQTAAEILKKKSDSRQCVVGLWRHEDLSRALYGDKKDLPCTLTWQFLVRRGQLEMIVNMRSNDLWIGFPYDVYVFRCIQTIMAYELGIEVGDYVHSVGSLHLYRRNCAAAYEIHNGTARGIARGYSEPRPGLSEIKRAMEVEEQLRREHSLGMNLGGFSELMRDTLLCVAHQWVDVDPLAIRNPDLRGGLDRCQSDSLPAG